MSNAEQVRGLKIVNAPQGWAHQEQANRIAALTGGTLVAKPIPGDTDLYYPFFVDDTKDGSALLLDGIEPFIPVSAILVALDKREQAKLFKANGVPTPETYLVDTLDKVGEFLEAHQDHEWILKYPTLNETRGHQVVSRPEEFRALREKDIFGKLEWPAPYIVQRFHRREVPEVFRAYCVDGNVFAWNVRRFPEGVPPKDLVAHLVGALYYQLGTPPQDVQDLTTQALKAVGLYDSFGVIDFIKAEEADPESNDLGPWRVIEVNTDGFDFIVDRGIAVERFADGTERNDTAFVDELDGRIAQAVQKKIAATSR